MGTTGPGSRIGDYVIEAELTTRPGVYASTHRLLPRRAHIIVTHSPAAFELARVLEQLRHPAVPRIYECGQLADRRPWLAVAVIEGPSLAERLALAPLGALEAAALIRDVASILAHAHACGIVYGGMCAEHVAQTTEGWKLVDWSEAGPADDHATDLAALGALAYAALARALPTLPLATRCPALPSALVQLIERLLAGVLPAEHATRLAAELVEDLALPPPVVEEAAPIAIEDIILLDVRRPPPIPVQLRVRAQGTGPVSVPSKKES